MKRNAVGLGLLSFLVLAATSPAVLAQKGQSRAEEGLRIEGKYTIVPELPFKVIAPAGADDYDWTFPTGWTGEAQDNVLTVSKAPEGTSIVKVKTFKVDFEAKRFVKKSYEISVSVGKSPTPPGPDPGPGPGPGPGPTPGPAPIAAPGLHVLIVYESADLTKVPASTQAVVFSKQVRDYLRAHCARDADSPQGAFWMLDRDADVSALGRIWQDAFKRPRTSVPWLIVSNPDKGFGYEGPLPSSVEAMLALLRKGGDG